MKIGIDAQSLSFQLTGIGYYLKSLLDEIQQVDHTNHYYLISNRPIKYNLRNPKWYKIEEPFKKKLTSAFWVQVRVPFIVSKVGIDLFWSPHQYLPISLSPKVKTVLTVHDLVHLLYPSTMILNNLLTARLLMPWSLQKADCVIAVSQSTASDIGKYYRVDSKKIHTIYHGVPVLSGKTTDAAGINFGLPSQYFLFVGTLDPRKNFKRLFKAFELTKPENHGVHLVFIGGVGWKNKEFLEMLKTHPLKPYVHFPGYVTRERLEQYYKNALCLLFPSLYEGFGFPILEAMSFKTPVITSNNSSMPEVAGDAALLVDPYNVKALAGAMCEIIKDERLREQLALKGLENVKSFSWKKSARETMQVFEKAM